MSLTLSLSLLLLGATAEGGHLRADDYRIASVAHRIARDAAAFCTAAAPLSGLALHHLAAYGPAMRAEVARDFQIDRGPGVLAVVAGSAAARAGFQPGDVLLQVNGVPLPTPAIAAAHRSAAERRASMDETERLIETALGQMEASFLVLRGGESRTIRLAAETGCPMRARLARSSQRNAFADGRHVVMTTALLAFVESDDELALILAHELAHNLLGHRARLEEAGVRRGLLRGAGRRGAAVRKAEAEADRLAVRLAWAAGYDVLAAAPMWRRYQRQFGGLQLFATHPSLAEREANWNAAIAALPSAP